MKLNFSSFKKFALLTGIFIVFIGGGLALAEHGGQAKSNSQPATHGVGYQLQATPANMVSKITPSTFLCESQQPTAMCRCQNNDSNFCLCLKAGTGVCTFCLPGESSFCAVCTVNGSMVACRINDNDNDSDDHGGVTTPTTSVSGNVGHETIVPTSNPTPTSDGNSSGGPSDNNGGNTTGNDNNTPPSTNCPTNPREMFACRAPGNNNNCPYLEVCRAGDQ